jgi:DNA-binding PadR family transcriptional regulator
MLVTIRQLGGHGYGVSIRRDVSAAVSREISLGAVYATADRLEAKHFISSRLGDATMERGGKPKRLFRIEPAGVAALAANQHPPSEGLFSRLKWPF